MYFVSVKSSDIVTISYCDRFAVPAGAVSKFPDSTVFCYSVMDYCDYYRADGVDGPQEMERK